jgi:predicted glycoside hydrolase/deacetylase ChbG (UPF0249 family)
MMAAKRLVINGDDLGLLPGIDRGLARAAGEGIVSSLSLLANGPAFAGGVEFCRSHTDIGIGVHLALVEGRALTTWDDGGMGRGQENLLPVDYRQFIRDYTLRRINLQRVTAELRAQLERILGAGIRPDHLDGHQHLHLFPPLAPVFAGLGREYGIPALRLPRLNGPGDGICAGWKGRLLRLGARHSAGAYGDFFTRPDALLGTGCSGRLTLDAFRRLVKAFTDGPAETAELMCHPGEGSATTLRASLHKAGYRSPWDFHWATELDLLCSGEARRFVESLGVDIVTYRDLDGVRDSGGAGQ